MTVLKRDTHYHTYADYLTWSRTYGDELIDGAAYVREPPSPTVLHQGFVLELARQAAGALEDKPFRVCVAPLDVRLPRGSEEDNLVDTVVQPDVFIVTDLQKLDARGVRGAPDWIVEVLSSGTARHDQCVKLPVYERAGVREVWFIHPVDLTLTIYNLEAGCYGRPIVVGIKGKTRLTAVPDVTIDWDRLLARV
jgi:Uma2 family endonuclease